MGIHRGPNLIKEDLVFGYDTGYGVSDNTTATRFYPGKPISNSINGGADKANAVTNPSLGSHGASVTTEIISYGNRKNVFRIYSTNTSGYYMVNQQSSIINTSGNVYTYSFDYKKISGTNSSFSPSAFYKNGYKSPDAGSAATSITDTIVDLEDGWKRLTRTYTSTYSGYNFYRTNLNTDNTLDFEYLFDNFMVNEGTPVPFVDSTRSNTASLIDLKKTTDIDVSNVSFDSTGQPDFDGAGDFIKASSTHSIIGDITLEAVFNEDSASAPHTTVICTDTGHQYGVKLMSYKNTNRYGLWLGFGSSSYVAMHAGTLDNNTTYHLVGSWKRSTGEVKIYLNGVLKSTLSTGQTSAISLNEAKIVIGADYHSLSYGLNGKVYVGKVYQKVLTDDEVKENFNAIKNRFNI
jgi:hypothetical protein